MINFSFIILFHNNSHTDIVIDAIKEQMIEGDEIIIVNDHSEKSYLSVLKRFGNDIKLVHSDCTGNRSYNRNFGAKYAKNEYLMFVDGDIILLPYAVNALRITMQQGYVGAVGNVIRSNNTPNQMNILTGIDYMELFKNKLNIQNFIDLSIIDDRRQAHIIDKIATDSLWEYFFTAYCAVKKSVYETIGGFDTRFKGWGVEDYEFGYRLKFVGKLEYNNSAYGVHVPHERNLYRCLLSNRINLYRFLGIYPRNEIELHMTFGNSLRAQISMDFIKKSVMEKNTYIFDFPKENNTICINELTREFPNGCVKFTGVDNEEHILELFGLALPFRNKNFECAYLSENIFIYPESFASLILSEALRLAKKVHIIKVKDPLRIHWREEQISGLTRISKSNRIVYMASGLCDFNLIDCGEYYDVNGGFAEIMNDNFVVPENFYLPEIFEKTNADYLLLNLTNATLPSDLKDEIERTYNLNILDIYNPSISFMPNKIVLSNELAGDLYRIHTPIVYVIPQNSTIDKTDRWWQNSFRDKDIIFQKT